MVAELVVDASIVVAVVLEEPLARSIDVFDRGAFVVAPDFLQIELANALTKAAWRTQFDPRRATSVFTELHDVIDLFVPAAALASSAVELAARLRCSACDAAYLVLARERSVAVATADRRFADRATAAGLDRYVEFFS